MRPLSALPPTNTPANDANVSSAAALGARVDARRGQGRPLDAETRSTLEPRFGHSFGSVRVHTDSEAAALAGAVDASAFAVGNDIYFGDGAYAPRSEAGGHLVAHELAHVVQATSGASNPQTLRRGPPPMIPPPRTKQETPQPQQAQQTAQPRSGQEVVPGLGARKVALTRAGGNSLDMAIAMLETRDMQATYVYGDNKTGDSANFGIFKQNWFMIRNAHPPFAGLTATDYNRGAALNTDLGLDVRIRHQSSAHYGAAWFSGHRNGETGVRHPNTPDILRYQRAVTFIQGRLDSDRSNLTNDVRFWVDIPAI